MLDTIITPLQIHAPLYEEELEFNLNPTEKGRSIQETLPALVPVVTFGQPQWWNLARLAREKGLSLPAEIALLERQADFYLLMLSCSFRPRQDSTIEWVRFTVYLRPKTGQEHPIAFDLYPREIREEAKTELKISIAPSLKFAGFEAGLGSIVTTIDFGRVEPIIIGYGALESTVDWDFHRYKPYPILGSKFMYLIVKKPREAIAVRITLNVVADILTKHGLFTARAKQHDEDHRSTVVCGD
jgi:hypothetical protein